MDYSDIIKNPDQPDPRETGIIGIDELVTRVQALESQVSALTSLMKDHWLKQNGYNIFNYGAGEEDWEEFKKKLGLI